jgi:hypothetical protein
MKKILNTILATLVILAASGCMTHSKMAATLDSWVGVPVSSLMEAWGPPTNIMDAERGGKIYVYDYSGSMMMPGIATTNMNYSGYGMATATTTYGPSVSMPIRRYRMFWVSKDGIIERWSYQGL